MGAVRQIWAVVTLNLANILTRLGSSAVTVIGIACVVGVLISVLALANGFARTAQRNGAADRVVVLGAGALSEAGSSLSPDTVATITSAPGVRQTAAGQPVASAEALTILDMTVAATGLKANVALRGVGRDAQQVRPEVRIIRGRMFRPGLHELVVGHALQAQFRGLELGDHLNLRNELWTVVGVFDTGGDARESEMMADASTVLATWQRTAYQSVTLRLVSSSAVSRLKSYLESYPGLNVDVHREPDFIASQSGGMVKGVSALAFAVGVIMAVGAVFAALNTMYSAVSARGVEIATLRAIGFGGSAIAASVFAEIFALAFLGAAVGVLAVWVFFNGMTVATLNPGTFTQLVFRLSLDPPLVIKGLVLTSLIALVGGAPPALRAIRRPIVEGLRTLA